MSFSIIHDSSTQLEHIGTLCDAQQFASAQINERISPAFRKILEGHPIKAFIVNDQGTQISGAAGRAGVKLVIPPAYFENQQPLQEEYAGVLAHESAHIVRKVSGADSFTLADHLVDEGIALHFGRSVDPNHGSSFDCRSQDASLMRNFLDLSQGSMRQNHFDYARWFHRRPLGMYPQAGYYMADFIVGSYLEGTGKKPGDILTTSTGTIMDYAQQRIVATVPMSQMQADRWQRMQANSTAKPA